MPHVEVRHRVGNRMIALCCSTWLAVIALTGPAASAVPVTPIVPGFDRLSPAGKTLEGRAAAEAKGGGAVDAKVLAARGELLLGELNCLSCHRAENVQRADLRLAPDLSNVGARATPEYLSAYVAEPHVVKPGTVMPEVFHRWEAAAKADAVEAITHYLVSKGGPIAPGAEEATQLTVTDGERLFHTVGCVACHAPRTKDGKPVVAAPPVDPDEKKPLPKLQPAAAKTPAVPLPDMARKTTVEQLTRFLREPHLARPSGRMPSLNLAPAEARAIAVYLLKEQLDVPAEKDAPPVSVRGLKMSYWEAGVTDAKPETIAKLGKPKLSARVTDISAAIPGSRPNNWVAQFAGEVTVPQDGRYTFAVTSDDGSRLYVDGKQLIDNDGIHPPTQKRGQVELKAGAHPFVLTFFQAAGEAELKVEWQGPGVTKGPIPGDALTSLDGKPMRVIGAKPFAVDREKATKGSRLFASLGCANCHVMPGERNLPTAKALAALNVEAGNGCLAEPEKIGTKSPNYDLSADQKAALKAALKNPADLAKPLTPAEQSTRGMAAMNCYACHQRDGVGGVAEDRQPFFSMTADFDMGEEGKLPPRLTGIGAKLKADAIEKIVCEGKLHIRPVLATRMPRFQKPAVVALLAALPAADADKGSANPGPAFADEAAKAGRTLFGVRGLGCVNCHGVVGFKSLGMPAPDLTSTHERLRFGWFNQLLHDPNAVNPGTRMPAFWPGDAVMIKGLGGDTAQGQMDALYAYLSLGTSMALPAGLQPSATSELVPTDEPIVHRTFMADVGPRAVLVGYPEQVNVAFDANQVRLAKVWRGRFFDTKGMWEARGGNALAPLGTDVLNLPTLPTFATLADPAAAWPVPTSDPADGNMVRNTGGRFLGYTLDKEKRPTFRYAVGGAEVREQPVPKQRPGGALLIRRFDVAGKAGNLYLLAATGKTIELKSPTEYLVDGRTTVRLSGIDPAKAAVRDAEGGKQLVLPVTPTEGKAAFEIELAW